MKHYKCKNCKREGDYEQSTIMVQCGCGYPMYEVVNGHYIKLGGEDGDTFK